MYIELTGILLVCLVAVTLQTVHHQMMIGLELISIRAFLRPFFNKKNICR